MFKATATTANGSSMQRDERPIDGHRTPVRRGKIHFFREPLGNSLVLPEVIRTKSYEFTA
jgi:hypothetical protein